MYIFVCRVIAAAGAGAAAAAVRVRLSGSRPLLERGAISIVCSWCRCCRCFIVVVVGAALPQLVLMLAHSDSSGRAGCKMIPVNGFEALDRASGDDERFRFGMRRHAARVGRLGATRTLERLDWRRSKWSNDCSVFGRATSCTLRRRSPRASHASRNIEERVFR